MADPSANDRANLGDQGQHNEGAQKVPKGVRVHVHVVDIRDVEAHKEQHEHHGNARSILDVSLAESDFRALGAGFDLPDGGRSVTALAEKAPGGAFDPRDVAQLPAEQLGYKAEWVVERFRRYNLDWDITGLKLESLNPEAKAPVSILPSSPMSTIPERSDHSPARQAKMSGTASRMPEAEMTMRASIASSAIALAALILANQISSLRRLVARPAEIQGIVPQLALKIFPQDNLERLIFFALAATVAVCEELVYRGFVQLVFESLSGGVVAAGIVGSAAMFGLAHLYQGRKGLFTTSFLGLLFSIIRAWTGSLLAPLVAHFVADFTIGLMAPSRLRTAMASHTSAGTRGLS